MKQPTTKPILDLAGVALSRFGANWAIWAFWDLEYSQILRCGRWQRAGPQLPALQLRQEAHAAFTPPTGTSVAAHSLRVRDAHYGIKTTFTTPVREMPPA